MASPVADVVQVTATALRRFVVVGGAWSFRISLIFRILSNGGPVGFGAWTFTAPALAAVARLQVLLPLAVHDVWRTRLGGRTRGDAEVATA